MFTLEKKELTFIFVISTILCLSAVRYFLCGLAYTNPWWMTLVAGIQAPVCYLVSGASAMLIWGRPRDEEDDL